MSPINPSSQYREVSRPALSRRADETAVQTHIEVTNSLSGWTSDLGAANSAAMLPNAVTLAGGETIEVVVVATVPDDAADSETNQTRFSVSSKKSVAPSPLATSRQLASAPHPSPARFTEGPKAED